MKRYMKILGNPNEIESERTQSVACQLNRNMFHYDSQINAIFRISSKSAVEWLIFAAVRAAKEPV